ncbi:Mismatch repair protein msh3, partial [Coemansia sp. RSA 2618]
NDIVLGTDSARAMVLTGPNAGGKSTLVRTVALIAIMAQCGAYVPARRARLSIVDAVVARMGASDNLMRGESTFMVEMRETAELLRHVSPRSLAILDELGRGTSTHDGAAIAFAVLSHLVHERPLVFFVTHYAHLVDAFAADARVRSCHMAFLEQQTSEADSDKTRPEQASEANDDVARLEQQSSQIHDDIADIIFLYKLVRGASVDSFGLNVARLAGLPEPLLRRARERARWMRTELDSKWAARSARQLQFTVAQARLG